MTEKSMDSDNSDIKPTNTKLFAKNLANHSKIKVESNATKRGLKRSYLLLFPFIFLSISIIWWLNFAEQSNNIELNIEEISQNEQENTEMTGARFASRTSDGENFEINAKRAIDNTPEQGLIHLSNPTGTIWTNKGNMINISSQEAILDQSRELTLFQGDVKIKQTNPKAAINASNLSVDLINKLYRSYLPVVVSSENITISGKDMIVNDKNGTISFSGHAKLIINKDK